jgi:hypothetical protein
MVVTLFLPDERFSFEFTDHSTLLAELYLLAAAARAMRRPRTSSHRRRPRRRTYPGGMRSPADPRRKVNAVRLIRSIVTRLDDVDDEALTWPSGRRASCFIPGSIRADPPARCGSLSCVRSPRPVADPGPAWARRAAVSLTWVVLHRRRLPSPFSSQGRSRR